MGEEGGWRCRDCAVIDDVLTMRPSVGRSVIHGSREKLVHRQ